MGKVAILLNKLIKAHAMSLSEKYLKQSVYDASNVDFCVVIQKRYEKLLSDLAKKCSSETKVYEQIFEKIRTYCIREFRETEKKLPIAIKKASSLSKVDKKKYAQNVYHTALRYLSNPNPFIHPQSMFADNVSDGFFNKIPVSANIPNDKKRLICCFWLFLCDPKSKLHAKNSRKEAKDLFVRELANINRSYNFQDTYVEGVLRSEDNLDFDRPSCPAGIKRRLENCLILFKEFDCSQSIGVKLKESIFDTFKLCKKELQYSFYKKNTVEISENEIMLALQNFVGLVYWNGDKNTKEKALQLINEWKDDVIKEGLQYVTFDNEVKNINLTVEKINFCVNLLEDIYHKTIKWLFDVDKTLKESEKKYLKKSYDHSFSNGSVTNALADELELKFSKYHNYANFFKYIVLENYENVWEIFIENLERCIANKKLFSKLEFKKEWKNEFSTRLIKSRKAFHITKVVQALLQNSYKQEGCWLDENEETKEIFRKNKYITVEAKGLLFDLTQESLEEIFSNFQLIYGYPINGMYQINVPKDGHCLFTSIFINCINHKNIEIPFNSVRALRLACAKKIFQKLDIAKNILVELVVFLKSLNNTNVLNPDFFLFLLDTNDYNEKKTYSNYVIKNFLNMELDDIRILNDSTIDIFVNFLGLPNITQRLRESLEVGNCKKLVQKIRAKNIKTIINIIKNTIDEIQKIKLAKNQHNELDVFNYASLLDDYIKFMQSNAWGGEYEIGILAELLKINIRCLKQENGRIVLDITTGKQKNQNKTVSVLHCGGNHYQALMTDIDLNIFCETDEQRFDYLYTQLKDALNYLFFTENVKLFKDYLHKNFSLLSSVKEKILLTLDEQFFQKNKEIPEQKIKLVEQFSSLIKFNVSLRKLFELDFIIDYVKSKKEFCEIFHLLEFCEQYRVDKNENNKLIKEQNQLISNVREFLVKLASNINCFAKVKRSYALLNEIKHDENDRSDLKENYQCFFDMIINFKKYSRSLLNYLKNDNNQFDESIEQKNKTKNINEILRLPKIYKIHANVINCYLSGKFENLKKGEDNLSSILNLKIKFVDIWYETLKRRIANINNQTSELLRTAKRSKDKFAFYKNHHEKFQKPLKRMLTHREDITKKLKLFSKDSKQCRDYTNLKREYDSSIRQIRNFQTKYKKK